MTVCVRNLTEIVLPLMVIIPVESEVTCPMTLFKNIMSCEDTLLGPLYAFT